jgi:hypothetical protein
MGQSIVFPEWLNANTLRNYPLKENASRTDISGNFTIPNDLLVSAQINFSRDYVGGSFFVSKIVTSENSVRIVVSFNPEEENSVSREIGAVTIGVPSFSQFSYYSFNGQGDDFSVLGSLGIGNVSSIINEGIGEFLFEPDSTPFEVNALFVSVPALKTVEIYNSNDQLLHRATEILKLKEGDNIKLEYISSPNDPYGSIKISAVNPDDLVEPEQCENATEILPPCIRKINGVSPNSSGTIFLWGSECIEVEDRPNFNALEISDPCSESCCGCVELQALTEALEQLKLQEEAIRNLINSTQGQQSEFLANIISNL